MSIHTDCGANIKWAKRSDDPDRFSPPLEFHGFYYIVDESGSAIEVTTYQPHICDPERMKKYQDRIAQVAKQRAPKKSKLLSPEYEAARQVRRDDNWKIALKVECETCGAKPRSKCRSKNFGKITLNPHPARIAEGMRKDR